MPAYKDIDTNTWYSSFHYTDWHGQNRRAFKRGFEKKKDALDYEREFLLTKAGSTKMLFASFEPIYLKALEPRIKETTLDTKSHIIKEKILPFFSDLKICDITPSHIFEWQNSLLKQGYSQTYLRTINNQLTAMFNFAVKFYKLPVNPCHAAGTMGKKNANAMQIWTLDEYNKFIEAVDKPLAKALFMTLYWTGIREGELLALTPADISSNKIRINKTYTRLNKQDIVGKPKTPKSEREITIPEFLYTALKEYMAKLYGIKKHDRIFNCTKYYLAHEMRRCSQIAGVKKIRIHDLRHSHASLLIEQGYNILVISERLGHEKPETTWNIYAHLYPNKHSEVADELNKLGQK